MDNFRDALEGLIVPLLLSLFGGAAKVFREGFKSLGQFVGSLFVAGFSGVIVYLLIHDSAALSAHVKAACSGLSGYGGGVILDVITKRFLRKVEQVEPAELWDGQDRRKGEGKGDGEEGS